jgi:integrase
VGRQDRVPTRAHPERCLTGRGPRGLSTLAMRAPSAIWLNRYAREVVPTKAPKTQREQPRQLTKLRSVFGRMAVDAVKAKHANMYLDKRTAQTAGLREIEVLSHAFTKAIQWGLIEDHPIVGTVRRKRPKPRNPCIEVWELVAALTVAPPKVAAYLQIKPRTGLRRSDLLRLTRRQIQEDGIHFTAGKTGKRAVIE